MTKILLLIFLIILPLQRVYPADTSPMTDFEGELDDDDLNIGGDIFNDFNEDIDASKVVEDERFYHYGRFFSFNLSLGVTNFDGNRGTAYENAPPTYGLGFNFFSDFQTAFGIGFNYSKHHFFVGYPSIAYPEETGVGLIDVSMLRVFFSARHYFDTSNLGTAITYSNPCLIGRIEYWYTTNKFIDQTNLENDSGGGIGFGMGFGLEFPIILKESFLGVEFLFHSVNFYDKYTQRWRGDPDKTSNAGYEDLSGNAYSTMVSYVISW